MKNMDDKLLLDMTIQMLYFIGFYEGFCECSKLEYRFDTDSLRKKCEKFYDELLKKREVTI